MRAEKGVVVRLANQGWLDRDFVLDLVQPEGAPLPCDALIAPSGAESVVLASFCPKLMRPAREAIDLKILVDCSGSMAGDSIKQAKAALHKVFSELTPADKFTLSRFGSSTEHDFTRLTAADSEGLARAGAVLAETEANLGGTEMEEALVETFTIRGARGPADVLLITDGEIWDTQGPNRRALESKHRIFAIGVGSAPAESLVRQLAEDTGGACEMVGPNEDIEAAILRMMLRIRTQRSDQITVDWGRKPNWVTQLPASLFTGDTIHVLAGFDGPVTEMDVTLSCSLQPDPTDDSLTANSQDSLRLSVRASAERALASPDSLRDLPRLAAWTRISNASARMQSREATKVWALNLALQHQIVTAQTSLFLVHERQAAEKSTGTPAVQQITHMMAAGWGGTSTAMMVSEWAGADNVTFDSLSDSDNEITRCSRSSYAVIDESPEAESDPIETDELDQPAYVCTIDDVLDDLSNAFDDDCDQDEPREPVDLTANYHFKNSPQRIFDLIGEMQALGLSEQQAVALLLWVLIERFAYEGLPGTLATRIVQSTVQTITAPLRERAMDLIEAALQNATLHAW
jgi:Ca-activated chloride channel family protein